MTRKLFFVAIFLIAVIITTIHTHASNIGVRIDGRAVVFTAAQPVIVDGSTLVPVRGVFEALGFSVSWTQATRTVTLQRPGDTIMLTVDSEIFLSNGRVLSLGVPAQLINDSTMIPLRAVLESVGYSVGWDNDMRMVTVTTPQAASPPPLSPIPMPPPATAPAAQITQPRVTSPFPFPFAAQDIHGNQVTHHDIGEHELFFVYRWATWCFACVQGLSTLALLAEEFEGRVGFIGILSDFENSTRAVELMQGANADFINVSASNPQFADLNALMVSGFVPRSIIVDGERNVVSELMTGSSESRDRDRILGGLAE